MSETPNHRLDHVLGLADNALVLGQRLGEIVTRGPELEEEMANANFALDYIGQARMLFARAAEIEGGARDEDAFAFLRDGGAFRNVLLVEQPNGDFAMTLARQFLFEHFYLLLLQGLEASTDARLAEIAAKAGKEIRYHLRHQTRWVLRLGDGTPESHRRLQGAIDELWRYTGELFAPSAAERWAAEHGVGPDVAALHEPWLAAVRATLDEATLETPPSQWMAGGGKDGTHTEHLGYLLAEMQFLQRAYPGAAW